MNHIQNTKRLSIVRIVENRPISGSKRWVVAEVVEKAR